MLRRAPGNGERHYLTDLGVDARSLALKDCPPMLSIGRLVEEHGFQFYWKAGKAFFVAPDGRRHECQVKNYVPHIRASTSSLTTSAVDSASPAPLQNLAVPGLAIASEAHPVAEDEDAGRQGQPPDAAEDAQGEECVEEGTAMTREAKLRLEAKSSAHLLTHLPMNSFCDACHANQANYVKSPPSAAQRRGASRSA